MNNKLTHQQIAFIDAFVEHNNALKAYTLAGYKPDRSNANKLVQKLSSFINQKFQERMALMTGLALAKLENIITDTATHNRDAIAASNSILDRAGLARASTQRLDIKQSTTMPENRKVIRNGTDQIMVGAGMLMPPLGDDDTTPFDTNDDETYNWLKAKHH